MTDQKVEGLPAVSKEGSFVDTVKEIAADTIGKVTKRGRPAGSKNKVKAAPKGQEKDTGRRIDSQHTMDIPRPGDVGRPRRTPMGSGRNLYVSERDLDRIEAMNCEPYWGYDNNKGRMERMFSSGWRKYLNEQGQELRAKTGNETGYFLMIKDKDFQKEDRALRSQRVNVNISEDAQLGDDRYYPDGRKQAVSVDYV